MLEYWMFIGTRPTGSVNLACHLKKKILFIRKVPGILEVLEKDIFMVDFF
jgi:hypothetical protein